MAGELSQRQLAAQGQVCFLFSRTEQTIYIIKVILALSRCLVHFSHRDAANTDGGRAVGTEPGMNKGADGRQARREANKGGPSCKTSHSGFTKYGVDEL